MGGEGMHGYISKGPVHRKVDAKINSMTRSKREDIARALEDPAQNYFTILREAEVGLTPIEERYLRDKWYIQPEPPAWNGWWREQQPIEPILRQGLAKAIRESIPQDASRALLPIDSYWMTGADQVEVEVIVSVSPQQVTRIIYTPPSDPPSNVPRDFVSNIWVIKAGAEELGHQEIEGRVEAVVNMGGKKIVFWKRRDF